MKRKNITKTIVIATIIFLAGTTIVFAHGGWGYGGNGRHMGGPWGDHMMGPGYRGGPMMGYGPGWGRNQGYGSLSEEDAANLEQARKRFYDETKELRRKINDMEIDLRDEMAKDKPEEEKLLKMQKEISKYRAEFDQKSLSHRLEMRKLAPEGFRGRGYGRGGGYCWR